MTDAPRMQPDTAEVLQAEEPPPMPMSPVPVDVLGPVRVQALPRKSAAARTVPISSNPVRILPADPHRAVAVLMATGTGNVEIGFTAFAFSGDAAATITWPAGTPFTCSAVTEIWVAQPTGSTISQVSYYRENWAQG